MRRVISVVCVLALVATAAAGERIERFLPASTFMYGGVEKLEAGFDKIMGNIHRVLPDVEFLDPQRFLAKAAEELDLAGVQTKLDFLADTGLDPEGPAGIAWVMTDPTSDPGRTQNENALLIFPVRDPARAEQLLAAKFLPQFAQMTPRMCQSTLQQVRRLKEEWERANQAVADPMVTWERLATLRPGLKSLRCPGGGDYTLGGRGEAPRCSVHAGNEGPNEGPAVAGFTRQALGTRTVGDVTLVGGPAKGVGYALTKTHIIFSNNPLVLEDAVNAAAGKGPRCDMAPPGPGMAKGDGRVYLNAGLLMGMVRSELARDARRRAPTPATERFFTLIAGAGGVTGDMRITDSLSGAISWRMTRNAQTARILDRKPSELKAFALVPDTAVAAWGANLARETFSVIGDIAFMAEPQLGGSCKLVMAACDNDGAFALTQGTLGDEIPNLLFILSVRDRETAEAAAESWIAVFGREFRPREGDRGPRGARRHQVDGIDVQSIEGLRGGVAFHFAFVGPFAVLCSNLADLRAVIALHKGQPAKALVRSERYRKLELPEKPANVISFMDMPALMEQIFAGEAERRARRAVEHCRHNMERIEREVQQFRQRQNRLPVGFHELRGVQDWCQAFGQQTKLLLDANTGKVSCPAHGTVAQFKFVAPRPQARRRREEEVILSAFGVWALHIAVEDGLIKSDGRLIPSVQRQGPAQIDPPKPPGPAEF